MILEYFDPDIHRLLGSKINSELCLYDLNDFFNTSEFEQQLRQLSAGEIDQIEKAISKNNSTPSICNRPLNFLVTEVKIGSDDFFSVNVTEKNLGLDNSLTRFLDAEKMLCTIFSSEHYSVFLLDQAGQILMANEASLKWLGYTKKELISQNVASFVHDQTEIKQLKKDIKNTYGHEVANDFSAILYCSGKNEIVPKYFHYIRKDKSQLPVRLLLLPIIEHGDKLTGYMAIGVDVSGMSEMQSRLHLSEQKMATIIDSAVDGIIIINAEGIIEGFNVAAEKMFGYKGSEVLGKNVNLLMPEPYKSEHDEYLKRYLNTQIPHIIGIGREVYARKKSGEVFPIDLAVGEVEFDDGHLFAGFVRDLTEKKKLEKERDSFFEMSLDLFCITDPEGRLKNVNSQWKTILGYMPREIEGKKLETFFHKEDFNCNCSELDNIFSGENSFEEAIRFRCKNGDYRWLYWNFSRDFSNKVVYGVARDMTNDKKMVEELQKAKLSAERSSRAKGRFIAQMSHELRTPLNSIIGFSNFILKNSKTNLSKREISFLDRIKRNGDNLLALINSILDFSKTESGFMEVSSASVYVPELINEIVDLMQSVIVEKKVKIIINVPGECAEINSDPIKLRQILQNLIGNAVKFSPNGTVMVNLFVNSASKLPEKVEIIDSGPGISEEKIKLIFEAFQQGDTSLSRKFGGAGLGLTIAKSFADLLGLKIEVESSLENGSCFSIIFANDSEYN